MNPLGKMSKAKVVKERFFVQRGRDYAAAGVEQASVEHINIETILANFNQAAAALD